MIEQITELAVLMFMFMNRCLRGRPRVTPQSSACVSLYNYDNIVQYCLAAV